MSGRTHVEVRALSRGITLLAELNRVGHARAAVLARATGIDRTTTYRLLATLETLGLVVQRESDDEFVLTANVRGLSEGYVQTDHLTRCATLHLGALFHEVLWPTDFAIFDRGCMVIRETTHHFSPYSVHRAVIGRRRPLFSSALGRAFLAGASEAQRTTVIEIARVAGPAALGLASPALVAGALDRLLGDFRTQGCASSVGETEPHISAIALPITGPDGALGAINMVFFRSALSVAKAAERFLKPMLACVARIEADMARDDGNAGDTARKPARARKPGPPRQD